MGTGSTVYVSISLFGTFSFVRYVCLCLPLHRLPSLPLHFLRSSVVVSSCSSLTMTLYVCCPSVKCPVLSLRLLWSGMGGRAGGAQTRLSYIHEHCRNAKKCVFGTGDLEAGMDLDGGGMGGENGGGGEGADHASGCGGLLVSSWVNSSSDVSGGWGGGGGGWLGGGRGLVVRVSAGTSLSTEVGSCSAMEGPARSSWTRWRLMGTPAFESCLGLVL